MLRLRSLSAGQGEETEDAVPCRLRDLSLGGAAVIPAEAGKILAGPLSLELFSEADGATLSLPVQVLSRNDQLIRLRFDQDSWIRHALIRKLFTGEYHRDLERIRSRDVMTTLVRTLFT